MSVAQNKCHLEMMGEIVNVRSYLDQPLPPTLEEELFCAFSLGPSLANTQPWELLVMEGVDQKRKLVDSTLDPFLAKGSYGAQRWVATAPTVVIVLIEKRRALARLGEKGILFAIQDTFSAIQNFRITAAAHNVSTSCVREFDPVRIQSLFGLPWYIEPVAILTAGYSEEEKEIPPRLPISEMVHRGRWE